jgi:formyltetrahydrofolate synthetase
MAILALCTDLADLRERIGRIVVANDGEGNPVTADDICVAGALAVLMKVAQYRTFPNVNIHYSSTGHSQAKLDANP